MGKFPGKNRSSEMNTVQYNNAKLYEIILFSLNNTSTNMYNFMMGFVTYYATGIAGLAVLIISTLLTAMRIFDGLIDPFIGYVMDKTDGKFGKFRPFLVIGNGIMILSIFLMYNTTHLIANDLVRLIYFVVIYFIYIIGYSLQTTVTKTGQTVITNNPKQRPLFSTFDSIFTLLWYTSAGIYVSNYLVPKYGGFTYPLFVEFTTSIMLGSLILMVLAIIGIWRKDRTEYFGVAISEESEQLKFKDYWPIIKNNRALQMLCIAASTDKLGSRIKSNSVSGIILFGIIIGNYEFMGQLNAVIILPTLGITILGTWLARKFGQKEMYVASQATAFVMYGLAALWLLLGDPANLSMTNLNGYTVGFIIITILGGIQGAGDALQISMIADVTDYETARSGKFVPGIIGTIFSFIDNFVSSFATTVIGFVLAAIGFTTTLPEVGDALTPTLLITGIALYFGAPMISWIIALISMKFYPLNRGKMVEVQQTISDMKQKGLIDVEHETA